MIDAELSNQAVRAIKAPIHKIKKVKKKHWANEAPDISITGTDVVDNKVGKTNGECNDTHLVTFASLGVCEELCQACELLKWKAPTKIQQEAIPWALKGRDIIGLAETGSGKTGAFALPIVQRLLDNPQRFFAVALAPTRELCVQIGEQFEAIGAG